MYFVDFGLEVSLFVVFVEALKLMITYLSLQEGVGNSFFLATF